MGCDGGTIPRRNELVKAKSKKEQIAKDVELRCKWTLCSLTQETLRRPIVVCQLGFLYNKESIINYLLKNISSNRKLDHVKSLKDVREISFKSKNSPKDLFVCPVTGLEMSGNFKFIVLWNCGCVLSHKALLETHSEECLICLKPFSEEDLVILNGSKEDIAKMKHNMSKRRKKLRELRKRMIPY